jgi:hypothetical protein
MESSIVERAVTSYEVVRAATRRHAFENGVEEFARILADIPIRPPDNFSDEDFRLLKTVAEGVIECIEQRVDTQKDPGADQLRLVKAVYEIRREVEVIEQWHRDEPKKR